MKDTIDLILTRASEPRLKEPAPGSDVLNEVFTCAARAPDHALLRPWRYLVVAGDDLVKLGEVFKAAADDSDPFAPKADKLQAMPLRAPMLIVGITCHREHPKVPLIEQQLSTGAGMAMILLALEARGFAGMWRTGPMAYHPEVRSGLGLAANETITGFLYVGTPVSRKPHVPRPAVDEFVSRWPPS
jgi:nitroreductase